VPAGDAVSGISKSFAGRIETTVTEEKQSQTPNKTVEEAKDKDQVVVPLHAEEVSVAKRRVVTGQVKVGKITRESEQLVEELLEHEHVEIERIAIGKQVDKAPAVREEGDTLIIPILEEIVVVERRLFLKEEIRVRRTREKQPYQERVVVRKQEAVITRL
jgi:stress response protein YsnF